MDGKLQRDPSDALGWLLDYMLACARGDGSSGRPCPKAVARAHAQLKREREALATSRVYDEIATERGRQDAKWGEQNHPSADPVLLDRPGGVTPQRLCEEYEIPSEARAKFLCQLREKRGEQTWPEIVVEELSEAVSAFADGTEARGRAELVQLAAVVVQWIECIDRRAAKGGAS